ncbi:MAG: histidine kinase, partial [Spirochaetaceae bacterium]|nr:histidine kinase [Spirochaetaceae bacterium]
PAIPLGIGVFSDDDAGKPIGFAYMAVNLEVIFRFLDGYGLDDGSRLFIAMGDRAYGIVGDRSLVDAPEVAAGGQAIRAALSRGESSLRIDIGGRAETLVLCGGSATGWVLAQILPPVRTAQARGLYPSLIAVALFIVLLVALVLIAVNRAVNHPIARINKRVALISTGDFSHDPGIEWENELGNIGRALNRMSRDIEELIERRVEDEKSKKELEFRVLQSQINPHFLYNTLGAIKWMAEIRKAPGIAEMVNSLAALLRHAARGAEGLVTLDLELELVGEYCTIQRYRSANLFELRVDLRDESLRRCKVVKFMLQPIVENAIMHGIEPKMAPGLVTIEAYRFGPGHVRIDVVDDGVGIARERLANLSADRRSQEGTFNHIGMANVDERLKLAFGEEYGLSVESEEGAYTKVSFLLPYIVDPVPAGAPAQPGAPAQTGGGPCSPS